MPHVSCARTYSPLSIQVQPNLPDRILCHQSGIQHATMLELPSMLREGGAFALNYRSGGWTAEMAVKTLRRWCHRVQLRVESLRAGYKSPWSFHSFLSSILDSFLQLQARDPQFTSQIPRSSYIQQFHRLVDLNLELSDFTSFERCPADSQFITMRSTLCSFVNTSLLTISTLVTVLPTEMISLKKRDDACSAFDLVSRLYIDVENDINFCATKLQSFDEILSELKVWSNEKEIFDIALTFSNENYFIYENQNNDKFDNLILVVEKMIQFARLWKNDKTQHLEHLYIKTNKQIFDVEMSKSNAEYFINIDDNLLIDLFEIANKKYFQSIDFFFWNQNRSHWNWKRSIRFRFDENFRKHRFRLFRR